MQRRNEPKSIFLLLKIILDTIAKYGLKVLLTQIEMMKLRDIKVIHEKLLQVTKKTLQTK